MPNDRAAGASRVTPVSTGLLARASGALAVMRGDAAAWFGPGQPPAPIAPATHEAGAVGRAFDYPFATNLNTRPRDASPVTFVQLRRLADAHDLTRIAIETRKDQISALPFTITRVDGEPGDPPDVIAQCFRRPDRRRRFDGWVRMLLEDLLVIDAPAVYVRRTQGGEVYAAEPIDGSLIRPLLDATGREPMVPAPAYVQILQGLPAVQYTADELLYRPRNPRTHTVYGYSPVEQILLTVNLALRRQAHQLAYYTEGTVPEALATTPKDWTTDQIRKFQEYWDFLIEGPGAVLQRRKLKFLPGDMKVERIQTEALFDEADEWLARVVCWAFSLPPSALTKQVNRATAETAQETAQQEGTGPLMQWVKALADDIIQTPAGFNDPAWEFTWGGTRELDPKTQADIDAIYIDRGVRTPKAVALERFGEFDEAAAAEAQARKDAEAAARAGALGAPSAAPTPPGTPDDETDPSAQKHARGRSLRRWTY